jgi:hypothetical protein
MPTTLLGVVISLVLIAPGLTYISVREFTRERTRPEHSSFRETGQVALVSVSCDALVLGLFTVARYFFPSRTFNVGKLVANPATYATTHFASLTAWSGCVVVAACVVAAALGRYLPAPERLAFHSAWWALFEDNRPEETVPLVSCTLDDGSWVRGRLYSYSRDDSDTPDRELTLTAPLSYRAPGAPDEEVVVLDDQAMSVSARRLVSLSVSYVPEELFEAAGDGG